MTEKILDEITVGLSDAEVHRVAVAEIGCDEPDRELGVHPVVAGEVGRAPGTVLAYPVIIGDVRAHAVERVRARRRIRGGREVRRVVDDGLVHGAEQVAVGPGVQVELQVLPEVVR